MRQRVLFYVLALCAAFAAAALFVKAKGIPSGIRAVEALLKPVFHKETINYYAGIYKEDPLFVTAVIKVESKFFRRAKSSRGAIGLMQIMPATGREIAEELKIAGFQDPDLENPETNIRFGFHYISKLRREFGEDDVAVLAAYNAGRKYAREWIRATGKKDLEVSAIQFAETRKFVEDVLSTYDLLKRIQRRRNEFLNAGQ